MKINRTALAAILHDAGDRLHAAARRVDPPEYGVRVTWDDDHCTELVRDACRLTGEDAELAADQRARIRSGELIAVGVVAIERDRRTGEIRETDTPASLWGIVTDGNEAPWFDGEGRDIFDLDELSGHLRTVADQVIGEARP